VTAVDHLRSEVTEFAERWVGCWNAHDVDGILALVTDDVVWQDPSIDGAASGLSEARAYVENVFRAFPDVRWRMPNSLFVSLDDDQEILRIGQPWASQGTFLGPIDPPGFHPTGQPFELEGFDVWDLERPRGQLRRVVSRYDALEFSRQVGLMPRRGSREERIVARLQRVRARLQRRRR